VIPHPATLPRVYCYRHPDRETGLSCSECGRPICTDCMTVAPVGLRCPEHSGQQHGTARVAATLRQAGAVGTGGIVTKALIGVNVAMYLITVAQGRGINSPGGSLFDKFYLYGPYVANGDWWRLITSAFLHANLLHILLNMAALWWFGTPVEAFLGRARFLLVYFVSGLAGSAGALIASQGAVTVGASGAIFGILGAALVLERQRFNVLGGSALLIIIINVIFSFTIPGISIGGHLGGLAGGVASTLVLSHFGKRHPGYGRAGVLEVGGVLAVGVVSVVIAYLRVRGHL
jgi:membrane associated rhomboid family serine protease